MRATLLVVVAFLVGFTASGQAVGDYQSAGTGDWNQTSTWDTWDGDSWEDAGATPTNANGFITILDTHVVTMTAGVTADQVIVASGGELVINAAVSWNIGNYTLTDGLEFNIAAGGVLTNHGTVNFVSIVGRQALVNGTVNSDGSFSNITGADTFTMGPTAVYNHDHTDGGTIPTAVWDVASTVVIRGFGAASSTPPGGRSQNFGNFTWDSPNMDGDSFVDLAGSPTNILGDFTVNSTGEGVLVFTTTGAPSLNVAGDFTINTSVFAYTLSGASAGTLSVDGDIHVNDGIFQLTEDSDVDVTLDGNLLIEGTDASLDFIATSGAVTLDILGNITKTAGAMNATGGVVTVNFLGGTQTYSVNSAPTGTINYVVDVSSTLVLGASNFLAGAGAFTLNGTVQVASTAASGAIQTGTGAGNIRVSGTRTYVSGSTIVYNGSSAQFMGNGHPTTTGINCTIANSAGVTLTLDRTIGGNLVLTSGNLTVGPRTLTLVGTLTPNANFITVASTSNITINGSGTFGTLATNGSTTISNLTINRSSSGLVTLSTPLTVSGTFTQTAGDLDISGVTFTIGADYARTSGNLRTNASSVLAINNTGTLPASFAFFGTTPALGTLTLDRASGTLSSGSNLTITSLNLLDGTFSNSGSITMSTGGTITRENGSMTGAPANTTNAYNVVYTNSSSISTGAELPTGADALQNLTVQGSDVVALNASVTVNGNLTLSGGTFNAGANTVTLEGNFVSGATSSLTSSTFVFAGTTTLSGGTSPVFGAMTINNSSSFAHGGNIQVNGDFTNNGTYSSGSSTVTFGGTTTLLGSNTSSFNNVQVAASATLTAHASTMNVAGNFIKNAAGTFNANGGTVAFNGTSTISGTAVFHHILVSGTLNGPTALSLTGNLTNNGTFSAGTGTVTFSGSTVQLIQGSVSSTFNNISVTNTSSPSVRVETNSSLAGVLTLSTNSTFDADGVGDNRVFTLLSTADAPTADAAIAQLPSGASVTGSVTVQRFMAIEGANNNRIYRYISSPVQSAPVSQLQVTIPVTGSFTGTSSCTGCGTNQSMFLYSEPVTTDINGSGIANYDDGYLDFPSALNSETLSSGRGYAIFVRGNTAPISTAGNALWSVSGPINSGTIDYVSTAGVSFTTSGTLANDGWNLVGNPYPSTIDWDASTGWSRSGLNGAIYMRDNGLTTPVYATYVGGVGTNGGDNLIPIGQAFFVKSDGGPITFTSDERVKVAGSQSTFFREGSIHDLLRVTLKQFNATDETIIRFHESATVGFDSEFDADKLDNATFNLFSHAEGDRRLAINALPQLECSAAVNLDLSKAAVGTYELVFSGFETFAPGIQFTLTDNFLGTTVDVQEGGVYALNVTSDAGSQTGRFTLTFSNRPVETDLAIGGEPVCHGTDATISLAQSQKGVIYTAYIGDEIASEQIVGTGNALVVGISSDKLSAGDNVVSIKGNFPYCDQVIIGEPYTLVSDAITNPVARESEVVCNTGSATLSVSGAPEGGSYRWYTGETSSEFIPNQFGDTYTTPPLTASTTYFVSIVNSAGCEGIHVPVTATVRSVEQVAITINATTLTSSYDTGNQWYMNGEVIAGATSKTFKPQASGVYQVVAQDGTCTTSAEVNFAVTDVPESGSERRLNIYPNPTSGMVHIEVNSSKPVRVQVRNPVGLLIATINLEGHGDMKTGSIDLTNYATGVYTLTIEDGKHVFRRKIVRN
jgi:hypothetical protein